MKIEAELLARMIGLSYCTETDIVEAYPECSTQEAYRKAIGELWGEDVEKLTSIGVNTEAFCEEDLIAQAKYACVLFISSALQPFCNDHGFITTAQGECGGYYNGFDLGYLEDLLTKSGDTWYEF